MSLTLILTLTGCLLSATAQDDNSGGDCSCDGPELVAETLPCVSGENETLELDAAWTGLTIIACDSYSCEYSDNWLITEDTLMYTGTCDELRVSYWIP
ncbi:MAG: hypothetical protein VX899_23790 [Myxococcota bacterium]|nr:hypothetical protein [Myxococcota bacterium]